MKKTTAQIKTLIKLNFFFLYMGGNSYLNFIGEKMMSQDGLLHTQRVRGVAGTVAALLATAGTAPCL